MAAILDAISTFLIKPFVEVKVTNYPLVSCQRFFSRFTERSVSDW